MSEAMKNYEVSLRKNYIIERIFSGYYYSEQEVKTEYSVGLYNTKEFRAPRSRQKVHQQHKETEPNKSRLNRAGSIPTQEWNATGIRDSSGVTSIGSRLRPGLKIKMGLL